jgi:vancomycin permeability regulator SanA
MTFVRNSTTRFSFSRPRSGTTSERGGIFFKLLFLLSFAVLVFLVYLARHPLMRMAGHFWIVDDTPVASDAIVVLGDDNYQADRATRAAELMKAGWAPRVIASGRYLRAYASIAELEERDLVARGVPETAVVRFAHYGEDTRGEAAALGQFIASKGWKRIIVVTSNYHTRRARYICERSFPPGTTLHMVAASDTDFDPDSWWEHRKGVKIFAHELAGMIEAMWELRHQDAQTQTSVRGNPQPGGSASTVAELYVSGTLSVYSYLRVGYSFPTARRWLLPPQRLQV